MSKKMFLTKVGGGGYLDKLVGYYPFNSNALDFSGKGNDGTIVGSPTFSSGQVGNAIDFVNDNAANYVVVPHTNDFNFSNGISDIPFSISMWVKFHSFNSANRFFTKAVVSGTLSGFHFGYQFGNFYMIKIQNNNLGHYRFIKSNANPFTLNTWYHVAYTDDGILGGEKLYVNGLEIASNTTDSVGTYTTMGVNTVNATFATPNWAVGDTINKHKGLINDAGIYKDRELTAIEILDIYNKGMAGTPLI